MRKKFAGLCIVSVILFTFTQLAACGGPVSEIPDDDGLIHVLSVSVDGEKSRALQTGESMLLKVTVLPQDAITKAVRITSDAEDVVSVRGETLYALKAGSATVTVKSVDGGKTDTLSLTVEDVRQLETNIYAAELDPARDARIDVTADESVKSGDRVRLTVKRGTDALSTQTATVGPKGEASFFVDSLPVTQAGQYGLEFAFPGNSDATVSTAYISDVEQRFYVTGEESWSAAACPETGGWENSDQHAMLKEDQVIVATGADTFGAVGKNVTLNNDSAPFIRFRVQSLDRAKWAAKALGTVTVEGKTVYIGADSRIVEEISETEATVDLRSTVVKVIRSPFDLVGTGELLRLGDIRGDYSLTLQLFIIGQNGARDGSVTMRDVEVFRKNGVRTAAVRADRYVPLESAAAEDLSLNIGETERIKPALNGADGLEPSFRQLTYVSDDVSVASVDAEGLVTAVGGGETEVDIRRFDGKSVGSFRVRVRVPVERISLSVTSVALETGETFDLSALVGIEPATATNKSVTYEPKDTAVVRVSGTGAAQAVAAGETAVEIASKDDPSKSASVKIIVSEKLVPVTGVSLDRKEAAMRQGDELTLNATVTPADATNKTLSWSSDDAAVVSVSDGKMTAAGIGSAVVTATSEDGGITASCTVTVSRSFRYAAGETFEKDVLYIGFSNTQNGDTATFTFTGEKTFTLGAVIGDNVATVYPKDIPGFSSGAYTVTAALERKGDAVQGFGFDSITRYESVYDARTQGEFTPAWGEKLTHAGASFESAGGMGCIEQAAIDFTGKSGIKLIVHAAQFDGKGDGAMYALKFTVKGSGEIGVGGDLKAPYSEIIDMEAKSLGAEGHESVRLSLIAQSGKVTFGAITFVTGGDALARI